MTNAESPAASELQNQFALAVERFEAGDVSGAQAVLEEMLTKVPDHPQILNYLAVTAHLSGDRARAQTLLTRTVEIAPDFFDAWNNLGLVTFEQDNPEAAAKAFQHACNLAPDAADPIINLGHALHAAEQCHDAVDAYRKGLAMQPNHPTAWAAMCRALLLEGQWADAADAADRQLALQPGHTVALALKSVALQEMGAQDALKKLVDFDRLIQRFEIDVPAGYPDLATFNQALTDHCQQRRSLKYAPSDKATEFGSQTNNLAKESDSPVVDLLAAIGQCADRYRALCPITKDHPFLSQRPDTWEYDIWATVLESGGHQQSHIHRIGWLSGVYYAKKPDVITSDATSTDKAGWIEFGQPTFFPKSKAASITQCYPPIEGCLYLFPSYFYHRTIPFFSETPRISFAFDLRDRPITRQVPFIDYVDG